MYKAPRDKLVCILNCCKVINNLLINASIALKDNPPGADDFLPVLIYVTLKASAVFFCKVYSIKLNIKLSFWITIHNSDFLSMFCHFICHFRFNLLDHLCYKQCYCKPCRQTLHSYIQTCSTLRGIGVAHDWFLNQHIFLQISSLPSPSSGTLPLSLFQWMKWSFREKWILLEHIS